MWKVEGDGGSVAYLLGSLHVLTPEWYPLSATINKAFAESKTLVEEVDIDETSDPTRDDGRALEGDADRRPHARSDHRARGVRRSETRAEKAGLPMMAIQRMKPWLVAITLMAPTLQAAGFKPELGVDRHFFDRAKASGMKRQALETMAYQLDRFDQLSPKLQEDLLKTTMEDLDTEVTGVKEMAQAWTFGNVAAIEKLTLAALKESPELYQRLLVERNTQLDSARRDLPQGEGRLLHRRRRRSPGRTRRTADAARQEGLQGHSAISRVATAECLGARRRCPRTDTSVRV